MSFFQPGPSTILYANLRDEPDLACDKAFIESLWVDYQPIADPGFVNDAMQRTAQRIWEMYLWHTLRANGVRSCGSAGHGPDLRWDSNGTEIVVEAVAPEAGDGPDSVPAVSFNVATQVPVDQIVLRITSAVAAKVIQYEKWLNAGVVTGREVYIIAINLWYVRHVPAFSMPPYHARALLGAGGLICPIARPGESAPLPSFLNPQVRVKKNSGVEVPLDLFLQRKLDMVSAVLISSEQGTDCATPIARDFDILMNPNARVPLPDTVFGWALRRSWRNGTGAAFLERRVLSLFHGLQGVPGRTRLFDGWSRAVRVV